MNSGATYVSRVLDDEADSASGSLWSVWVVYQLAIGLLFLGLVALKIAGTGYSPETLFALLLLPLFPAPHAGINALLVRTILRRGPRKSSGWHLRVTLSLWTITAVYYWLPLRGANNPEQWGIVTGNSGWLSLHLVAAGSAVLWYLCRQKGVCRFASFRRSAATGHSMSRDSSHGFQGDACSQRTAYRDSAGLFLWGSYHVALFVMAVLGELGYLVTAAGVNFGLLVGGFYRTILLTTPLLVFDAAIQWALRALFRKISRRWYASAALLTWGAAYFYAYSDIRLIKPDRILPTTSNDVAAIVVYCTLCIAGIIGFSIGSRRERARVRYPAASS